MAHKAVKLLAKMRESKANWKFKDVRAVYRGFGFDERNAKGSHVIFYHPVHKEIRATVPRHGEVPKQYIQDVIDNVDALPR